MQIKISRRFRFSTRFGAAVLVAGVAQLALAQVTTATAPQTASTDANSVHTSLKTTGKTLTGIVVDKTGTPVFPAAVAVNIVRVGHAQTATQPASAPGYRNLGVTTDSAGLFSVPDIAADEIVSVSVRNSDYRFVSGGDVTSADDGLHVKICVAKVVAQIYGRVVDAKGKPISGAAVWSADGGMPASTFTDAAGTFTLKHLPAGPVKIAIARGSAWAEQTVDSIASPENDGVSLTGVGGVPPAPQASAKPISIVFTAMSSDASSSGPAIGKLLLSRMIASKSGEARVDRSDLASYLAQTDFDAALHLAATVHKPGEALADGVVANFIEARLKADPRAAEAWAQPRIPQMGQAMTRIRSACELGIALSYTDAASAEKWYESCRADSDQPNAAVDINRARLVALAALIHKPADEAAHLKLLTEAVNAKPSDGYTRLRCAIQVARGDIAAAETLMEKAPPAEKAEFYEAVVYQCLKYSPSLCRDYLTKLQDALAPLAANGNESWRRHRATEIAISVIAELGATDPAGALAVAKAIPESDPAYPQALAAAARFQREAVAAPLWAAASAKAQSNFRGADSTNGELRYYAPQELLSIASEASMGPSEPTKERAPALWAAALAAAASEDFSMVADPEWALRAARFDPGIARMLLEHAYADARDQSEGFGERYWMLRAALAMSLIDPARAMDLLDRVPAPTKFYLAQRGYDVSSGTDARFVDYEADSTRLTMIQLLSLTPARRLAVTSRIFTGDDIDAALNAP